jgi:thioredoxin 1
MAWPRIFRGTSRRRNMRNYTKLPVRQETKFRFGHLINQESGCQGQSVEDTNTNMADNIQVVNDGNFETEVLTASKTQPVMVDFWAEWCRPCHMLAPTVAEIAQDYAGKLKVTKLNVDEAMNSAARFSIRGIPTLLVFKDGQMVEQIVGAVPKDQITKALERHIG